MRRKVSLEDVRKINEIYYECHNYAETARRTGWSASTVRSYVDPHFNPVTEDKIHRFDPDTEFPGFDNHELWDGLDNFGVLCTLSDEEYEEIKQLWEELSI